MVTLLLSRETRALSIDFMRCRPWETKIIIGVWYGMIINSLQENGVQVGLLKYLKIIVFPHVDGTGPGVTNLGILMVSGMFPSMITRNAP